MSNPLANILTAGLISLNNDMGNPSFEWNGETYEACPGSASESAMIVIGGELTQADLVLVVRRALFTDGIIPEEQQKLTYQSKPYRIARVSLDPMGALVRLSCVAPNRGL